MKLTTTPQEFQSASLQLLRASPASARITTTYHAAEKGNGTLTLKTYDPVSGAVVKFNTTKIADVGRLVAGLHRLAREQTGTPEAVVVEKGGADSMADAPARTEVGGATTPVMEMVAAAVGKGKGKKKAKKP